MENKTNKPSQITATNYLNDLYWKNQAHETKAQYKQLFLTAIYSDFEDYAWGLSGEFENKETHRIHIWSFVAKKLMEKGIVSDQEYDFCHSENERIKNNTDMKKHFRNKYFDLCVLKFKEIALSGKHIQEF